MCNGGRRRLIKGGLTALHRLRLSHALLLLGFTVLALSSNRNVLLLYWVGAPIAALYLAPALRRWLRARGSPGLELFRTAGFRGEQLRLRKCFASAETSH